MLFRVGPTPSPIDRELVERLSMVEPSTVGHSQDLGFAHGLTQIVGGRLTTVGTAFTVRLCDMDATAIHCAVDELKPGHVLVVDMGGDMERACFGAILSLGAKLRCAAGAVVDGMVTDYADLVDNDLPVYARGLSAMTTRALGIEGDINVPVSIGGVVVAPGDVVMADVNGVLFIAPDRAESACEAALTAQQREAAFREEVLNGASLAQASGAAALLEAKRVSFSAK